MPTLSALVARRNIADERLRQAFLTLDSTVEIPERVTSTTDGQFAAGLAADERLALLAEVVGARIATLEGHLTALTENLALLAQIMTEHTGPHEDHAAPAAPAPAEKKATKK